MNEINAEKLSTVRNEAAALIQKTYKKHHLKQLSAAIARIHELEAILTKFVQTDFRSQFNEIRQELEKKNTLCAIIEKQNEELTDRIVELEQTLLTERQKKYTKDVDLTESSTDKPQSLKKMRCSMNELSLETNRLSELLNATQSEKTALKTSFIELSVKYKNDQNIINELKHNFDTSVTKKTKLEFHNRSLRLKLRDALAFKELYYKLKNKSDADQKHFENTLNDLKATHWKTLQELGEYKEKDFCVQPLQTQIKQYQQKYEKMEGNFVSQQNKNKMLQTRLKETETKYFKAKKQINDLQNDNHKLMIANKKLLEDCMKYDSNSRILTNNAKKVSLIGIEKDKLSPRNNYLKNRKTSVSAATNNNDLNEKELMQFNLDSLKSKRCNFVYHWTIENVGEWLKHHLPNILTYQAKIPTYVSNFRTHAIDGNKLLLLDKVSLDVIGIDTQNIDRVLECIDLLRRNPMEYIQKHHHLLEKQHHLQLISETENRQTQTLPNNFAVESAPPLADEPPKIVPLTQANLDNVQTAQRLKEPLNSVKSESISLSFTDTNSVRFSPKQSQSNDAIRIELKTFKRKKNQLIVSIKMLTKQHKKCKLNNENGKCDILAMEINKKKKILIQAKQQILELKRSMQQLQLQNINETNMHTKDTKPILQIPTTSKSEEFQTNVSIKMFGDHMNSTKDKSRSISPSQKTFSDIISDTQSIIHDLKTGNTFHTNEIIPKETQSLSMDKFMFLETENSTVKSRQSDQTTVTDKWDPLFSPRIVNPFVKNVSKEQTLRQEESTQSLLHKIAMIQKGVYDHDF